MRKLGSAVIAAGPIEVDLGGDGGDVPVAEGIGEYWELDGADGQEVAV